MRLALVKIEVAAFVLGKPSDQVWKMADQGTLRHVFNFQSEGAARRDGRFWLDELKAPEKFCRLESGRAIDSIVGTRERLNWLDCLGLLSLSRTPLTRLCETGELRHKIEGRTRWVEAQSIKEFLFRRLYPTFDPHL